MNARPQAPVAPLAKLIDDRAPAAEFREPRKARGAAMRERCGAVPG